MESVERVVRNRRKWCWWRWSVSLSHVAGCVFQRWPHNYISHPRGSHLSRGGVSVPSLWPWAPLGPPWPTGHGRSDAAWFPRLGHKRQVASAQRASSSSSPPASLLLSGSLSLEVSMLWGSPGQKESIGVDVVSLGPSQHQPSDVGWIGLQMVLPSESLCRALDTTEQKQSTLAIFCLDYYPQ